MTRFTIVILITAATLLVVSAAQAATTHTQVTTAPGITGPGSIDNLLSSGISALGIKDNRDHSQAFTFTQATTVDKIVVHILENFDGQNVDFKLFPVSDPQANPLVENTPVVSYNFDIADSDGDASNDTDAWLIFDVDDFAVSNGDSYVFQIDDPGKTFNQAQVYRSSADVYAGGESYLTFSKDDGTSLGAQGVDLSFGVITVPEPASVALMGLGGLCLLARRKRG